MAKSPKTNKKMQVKSVEKIKPGKKNKPIASPKSPKLVEAPIKSLSTPKQKQKSPKSLSTVKNKKIMKSEKAGAGKLNKSNKVKKEKKMGLKKEAAIESISHISSSFASDLPSIKEQSKKAFDSLLKYSQNKKSSSLFTDLATRISLNIQCFKIPSVDMEFFNIRLPHTLYAQSSDVVLVIKHDKKRQEDYQEPELKSALFKQKLLTEYGIKVREVITLQQLRNEYSTYEAQRAFIKRIDVLLVDKSIVKYIPGILGREMYKKKKFPIPVSLLAGRDVAAEIDIGMRKSVLHVSTKGKSSNVTIGTDELTSEQLVENLEKIVRSLKTKFPGGWSNIGKLSIEALELPPLVVHFAAGGPETVNKSVRKSRGRREIVEDEISTQLNKRIKIYPDGVIEVSKAEESD